MISNAIYTSAAIAGIPMSSSGTSRKVIECEAIEDLVASTIDISSMQNSSPVVSASTPQQRHQATVQIIPASGSTHHPQTTASGFVVQPNSANCVLVVHMEEPEQWNGNNQLATKDSDDTAESGWLEVKL